jgi:hypothetical protein
LRECEHYYKYIFPNTTEYGSFEEYPVSELYTGPIAEINTESHSVAKEFYTHHKNALANRINFAGKYVISDWSFTSIGTVFAIIDAATGELFPFPYIVDWDFDFRLDSNLIIINPKESMPDFSNSTDYDCEAKWYANMKTYYYLFEDGEFKLLGPEEGFNLVTAQWLANEPKQDN